jgi:hypothetical protein
VGGLAEIAAAFRRLQDAGLATLCAKLTPRLRSAVNVFEGAASLISYELSEETFAADGGGGIQWELAVDEVRAVLALRVDFPPTEIAKLRL